MEHELPEVREAHLEDPALALALHDGVRQLARLQRCAGREVVEEVAVQVERVDEVVLEDVDQVEAHERVVRDRDRLVHVGERDAVGRVELVGAVEVRVEPVHHHHELVRVGPALLGVDDEGAVQALGDVRGQRRGVTVVEVQAERLGVELVHGRAAGLDQSGAGSGHAIHVRRVDAVEVDGVRVERGVAKADAQALAFTGPQRGPGDAAVVRPRGEGDAGGDLDLLLVSDELPLAQDATAGQARGGALVVVAHDLRRVEPVAGMVDAPAAAKAGVLHGAAPVRVGA
jgi:hypothetical protein